MAALVAAHDDCIAFHGLLHNAPLVGDQLRVPGRGRLGGLGQHWVPGDDIPTRIYRRGLHTNCLYRCLPHRHFVDCVRRLLKHLTYLQGSWMTVPVILVRKPTTILEILVEHGV